MGVYRYRPVGGWGVRVVFRWSASFTLRGRRAVGSHTTENVADRQQKSSNRVHRFARLKTQGKHPEIQHKTPHHQAYTRAVLPSWHRLAVGEHPREQRPNFIDRHPLSPYQILLVLLSGRDFGCDVDERRIRLNARL